MNGEQKRGDPSFNTNFLSLIAALVYIGVSREFSAGIDRFPSGSIFISLPLFGPGRWIPVGLDSTSTFEYFCCAVFYDLAKWKMVFIIGRRIFQLWFVDKRVIERFRE